jgi:hypothetical protein
MAASKPTMMVDHFHAAREILSNVHRTPLITTDAIKARAQSSSVDTSHTVETIRSNMSALSNTAIRMDLLVAKLKKSGPENSSSTSASWEIIREIGSYMVSAYEDKSARGDAGAVLNEVKAAIDEAIEYVAGGLK